MTASIAVVPSAAKHSKGGFGLDPLYDKQTEPIVHIQPLQQKTPHRYLQSPVFLRKATTSCPGGSRHHHHHQHQPHHSAGRRRRGNSEGDRVDTSPEERVHLLSELPWRKSGDFSTSIGSGDLTLGAQVPVPSIPRLNVPAMSPTLPRRYDHAPNFGRERTASMPMRQRPHFTRRGKQRARSQDSSPSSRKNLLELPIEGFQYSGSLVLGVQKIAEAHSPETPLADADGYLKLPSLDIRNSPESLRRYLGFNTDIDHNGEGITEEKISQSRIMCRRRSSSSSDSSTSTLT